MRVSEDGLLLDVKFIQRFILSMVLSIGDLGVSQIKQNGAQMRYGMLICNGNTNRSEWSPIRPVVIPVIRVKVRFAWHGLGFAYYPICLSWTTRSPLSN